MFWSCMVLHVAAENYEHHICLGSSEGISGIGSKLIVDFFSLHTLHFFLQNISIWRC